LAGYQDAVAEARVPGQYEQLLVADREGIFAGVGLTDHELGVQPLDYAPIALPHLWDSRSEWHDPTKGSLMLPHKSKLLLVEDEELVRELLAHILIDAGFAVVQADNGAAGLQAAHRLDGSLSMVITDINMPVMNGLEFARILQKTDTKVPFLFITAIDPALIHEAGIRAEVLAKPFMPDQFLEKVTAMLEQASGPGQPA
jgi:CheY-like chemotaxis protein